MSFKNDSKKLNHAFEQAKATLEIEGVKLTIEDEEIIKNVASGKLSRRQLIENLKQE